MTFGAVIGATAVPSGRTCGIGPRAALNVARCLRNWTSSARTSASDAGRGAAVELEDAPSTGAWPGGTATTTFGCDLSGAGSCELAACVFGTAAATRCGVTAAVAELLSALPPP